MVKCTIDTTTKKGVFCKGLFITCVVLYKIHLFLYAFL